MAIPSDFGFGADEQLLRDQARKFLDQFAAPERLRSLIGDDHDAVYRDGVLPRHDETVWAQAVELGWTGLAVPEAAGGLGISCVGVMALCEEVGRHAFPSPLLATVCATYVLRASGGSQASEWLERIAQGSTASLAITGAQGSWALSDTDVRAQADGDGWLLEGRAYFVQDAFKVDAFVVSARASEGGLALCVVPANAPGLTIERDHIADLTRDQGSLHLSGVRVPAASVVADAGAGLQALNTALPALLTVVSADLVGTSEWLLQTTVEYAKVRTQFERPLGFFQAVKHPLVDAMMAIDRARSLVYHAAAAFDHEPEAALVAARMAKSQASDASAFTGSRAIQLHGGIGFTWECDVHLFFKRGLHNEALYGDGVYQRARLADALIEPLQA